MTPVAAVIEDHSLLSLHSNDEKSCETVGRKVRMGNASWHRVNEEMVLEMSGGQEKI
jgi:hypothetical protein